MYIPACFRVTDLSTLHDFMRRYSFATLVTASDEPLVSHLPLLLESGPDAGEHGTLIGHFAKPNPHWQFNHAAHTSLAIFHGPHAYISPSWYRSGALAVPTWNYATVHAWGKLSLIEDHAATAAVLERTVETYEAGLPSPWKNAMPKEVTDRLVDSVVAFTMPIERIEGKFKLGQNRAAADRFGAIESLEASGDADSAALAAFARKHLGYSDKT